MSLNVNPYPLYQVSTNLANKLNYSEKTATTNGQNLINFPNKNNFEPINTPAKTSEVLPQNNVAQSALLNEILTIAQSFLQKLTTLISKASANPVEQHAVGGSISQGQQIAPNAQTSCSCPISSPSGTIPNPIDQTTENPKVSGESKKLLEELFGYAEKLLLGFTIGKGAFGGMMKLGKTIFKGIKKFFL